MDKTENQSGFFLELRTRLQSGLLVLSKDLAKDLSEVQLLCGPSSLEIKTPGCLVDLQLPAGVTIIQDSCREVPSAAGDGLHIRMQLHADQDTEAPPSLIESLKAQKSYCLVCQSCGEQVLMERVFNRVLPLPNGNWNALVDDWCCHPDPFAKKKLLPRKEDCLLGDTFILLSWERDNNGTLTQEPETLKPKENVKVICKNCRAVLGEEISPDTLKLYITEVTVRQLSKETENANVKNRSLFLEHVIAARLVELSARQSTFRFSLQGPSGKSYVLLWLLNTDTLLISSAKTSVNGSAFISSEDNSSAQHKSQAASGAVKVLYLPCSQGKHQQVIDAWDKDIGVHPLTLPVKTCHDVMQLLSASNETLPFSMRTMNTFKVAFMRL
nr:PREDICTED: E3 ubiquitin-protein ligase E3D isoform X2 [Lepisosteus oculatus]